MNKYELELKQDIETLRFVVNPTSGSLMFKNEFEIKNMLIFMYNQHIDFLFKLKDNIYIEILIKTILFKKSILEHIKDEELKNFIF